MRRLVKISEYNEYEWEKAKMDGIGECEQCGTHIEGILPYDSYAGQWYCKDCYEKIKNKNLAQAYVKYNNVKTGELYDTVVDDDTMDNYEIYVNPTNSELKSLQNNISMVIESDGTSYAWSEDLGLGGINSFLSDRTKAINVNGDLSLTFKDDTFSFKGNDVEEIIKNIFKYKNILSKIHSLESAYLYFTDLGYELEYNHLQDSKEKELALVGKAKDKGKDGEIIDHMETSTKGKTLFAHRLLHMWFKNPSKTNWTKTQIEKDHEKVVKAMFGFKMNHNIVDGLDKTLPKYLKDKSGEK